MFVALPFTEDAACAQDGPDDTLWFPDMRGQGSIREAKRICAGCPVKAECLETALSLTPPPHGVWGGTSERQRALMRTKRRRAARAARVAAIRQELAL